MYKKYYYNKISIDKALSKLSAFDRYKALLSKKHPEYQFNFEKTLNTTNPKNISLTLKLWIVNLN